MLLTDIIAELSNLALSVREANESIKPAINAINAIRSALTPVPSALVVLLLNAAWTKANVVWQSRSVLQKQSFRGLEMWCRIWRMRMKLPPG